MLLFFSKCKSSDDNIHVHYTLKYLSICAFRILLSVATNRPAALIYVGIQCAERNPTRFSSSLLRHSLVHHHVYCSYNVLLPVPLVGTSACGLSGIGDGTRQRSLKNTSRRPPGHERAPFPEIGDMALVPMIFVNFWNKPAGKHVWSWHFPEIFFLSSTKICVVINSLMKMHTPWT